ncbi:MAG: hypothetical protein EBU46_05730, partial [Nitrosomonadaceae bacterium]|nr:hypothetical protein [Nitrosomonadaceae bacterium]
GSLIRVYFWAEDMPIAQMDTELTYLHADHLDTPRIGTNSSGAIVWQWNSDAFGSLLPNEDPDGNGTPTTVNLRFPGQYFDKETNLRYNYFRDYDPRIGRYLESDPIGLMGGLNTFGYVGQNPLGFVDPTGECPACIAATVGAFVGAGTDLTLQLIQNGGTGSNLSFRSIRTSALAGTAFSTLGPTGLLLGRGGARSLPYGYSRYAGILNHGNVRFGWGYRRADDSNVLRSVINGRKTDIRGVRVSPRANPIRDGAVSGATGGGVKRAIGDSDNCKE